MYSDKIHARYLKAKGKLEKHGKTGPESLSELEELVTTMKSQTSTPDKALEGYTTAAAEHLGISAAAIASITKAKKELERAQEERIEQLRLKPSRVNLFIRLMMPVLVELYSASPATRLRSKVLNGLVKAIAFSDGNQLTLALKVNPSILMRFSAQLIYSLDSGCSPCKLPRLDPLYSRQSRLRSHLPTNGGIASQQDVECLSEVIPPRRCDFRGLQDFRRGAITSICQVQTASRGSRGGGCQKGA